MLGFLPGMSLRDAATREIDYGQSTSDRSGTENYNWQDRLGGFLGGYTREDVEKEMQRKLDKSLLETLNPEYGDTGSRLGVLKPKYVGTAEGIKGKTSSQLVAEQQTDKRLAGLLETYAGTEGANVAGINPNISAPGLQQLITSQLASNTQKKEDKVDRRLDRKEDLLNRREDFRESQAQRQTAYNNRVLDMKDARETRNARDKQLLMIIQGLNNFGQGFQ
jgi:hypothetical protein